MKNIVIASKSGRVYYVHQTRIIGTSHIVCSVWESTDMLSARHSSIGSHSDYGNPSSRGWVGEVTVRRCASALPVGESRFAFYRNRRHRVNSLCKAIIRRAGVRIYDSCAGGFQVVTRDV